MKKMTIHPFDWTATCNKYKGNEKTARMLATVFFKELPQAHNEINTAFLKKDAKNLYLQLHKLYGSCAFVEVPLLKIVTYRLCQATRETTQEALTELVPLMEKFNRLVLELIAYGNSVTWLSQNK